MAKFKIFAGLGGGFGGASLIGVEEHDSISEASNAAYEYAVEEYYNYEGMYGLRTIEDIMEEGEWDEELAREIYEEEMGSWLVYHAEEVSTEEPFKKYQFEVKDIGDISDGSHTFKELYYHRMVLFSVICNAHKDKAWKSWKHDDGTMFDDYFIVGITTSEGDYSYHYSKEHWDMFDVLELDYAPKWDGHKPEDIKRLCSLNNERSI